MDGKQANPGYEYSVRAWINSDAEASELVGQLTSSPTSVIATALEEYVRQCIENDRHVLGDIFGYVAWNLSFDVGVDEILKAVPWERIAEAIICDSHRYDAYLEKYSK